MKLKEIRELFRTRYTNIEFIASGGNAFVYSAKDCFGSDVAIKILDKMSDNIQEKRSRFIIETEKVLELKGKIAGIIPIIDYALPDTSDHELFWYSMPLAKPILDYINESINEEFLKTATECILQIAITLTYLHRRDIVHRDIKPSNIYYYNGRFCLADFGLVNYPGKNDLTRAEEQLGARATIAPEMKNDAKHADGKKADVYSLAKTLWMLITKSKYGFDGIYNPSSTLMGLKFFLLNEHLVELNQLLVDSTQDEPDQRPTMFDFLNRLYEWAMISNDFKRRNLSQWRYILTTLFHEAIPDSACWRNLADIINVLKLLGSMPSLNHMFIPTGGGMDLSTAEIASESGCIALKAPGFNIVKPQVLSMESIRGDFVWSYFRLDLAELPPVFEENKGEIRELVTEHIPGQYISWKCGNYGCYEDGSPLPRNSRLVERYLNGSFVFFSKASIYNQLSGTYDSRHNKMSANDFRTYIENMHKDFYCLEFEDFLNKYNEDPFDEDNDEKTYGSIEDYEKLLAYITKEYKHWDFSDICIHNDLKCDTSLIYTISFKFGHQLFSPEFFLNDKGKIREAGEGGGRRGKIGRYIFYYYGDAQKTEHLIIDNIKERCIQDNIVWDEHAISVDINLYRVGAPKHLFTKDEIKDLLVNGNDEKNNSLVIDGDGYARLIESPDYLLQHQYPVVHEMYCAYNNCVGKLSSLSHVDNEYLSSLEGWLNHLITKRSVYLDIYSNQKEDELLKMILKFYS